MDMSKSKIIKGKCSILQQNNQDKVDCSKSDIRTMFCPHTCFWECMLRNSGNYPYGLALATVVVLFRGKNVVFVPLKVFSLKRSTARAYFNAL